MANKVKYRSKGNPPSIGTSSRLTPQRFLDFGEIPSSKPPARNDKAASHDVEAFEHFARDFFTTLYGATVEKVPARGSDDGADLIVKVDGQRWLVSCKHWATQSVSKEDNAPWRLKQHKCDKFVAFYSPGPSSGLANMLESTQKNQPDFDCRIMDAGMIEGELISLNRSEGWLLAFRYFPKSYARIASTLVRPLWVYTEKDLVYLNDRTVLLPATGSRAGLEPGTSPISSWAVRTLLSQANEAQTWRAFDPVFVERVGDFARTVPGSFVRTRWSKLKELSSADIYPSWSLDVIRWLVDRGMNAAAIDICRLWSFWDVTYARYAIRYAHLLFVERGQNFLAKYKLHTLTDPSFCKLLESTPSVGLSRSYVLADDRLVLGKVVEDSLVGGKGYLAALLCFHPGPLFRNPEDSTILLELAKFHNEVPLLSSALDDFTAQLPDAFDRDDIQRFSDLKDRCISAFHVETTPTFVAFLAGRSIQAASMNYAEPWVPEGETDPILIEAWALGIS